jgi:DNA-binding winged helix-turn-helix (wHTH) protein/tetratricopeptide (TPR) repeat protein
MFWQSQTCYEFGPFRVDPLERQLLRNGKVVPLRPKVFDILLLLVENSGHILTKDDVMRRVWSNTVVEEGNIARNISTLRSALGEDSKKHQYIETIPWRGYRFVASVKEVRHTSKTAIGSIAVLPFVNVKGDPRYEYLCDGVSESLITSLAQLTNLRVTSRNSAFRYKRDQVDAQTAGRELKVEAVVMGRVAVAVDLVSVSLELVATKDDRHIWGAQFVRNSADIFALHDTIARKISEVIRLEFPARERHLISPRHTESPEAYSCYLKGRYFFNKLTPDGVQKGIGYFQQAIEHDPNYALAYAGLGDCHTYLAHRDDARNAVVRALELDESLGEARASLGFFKFIYDWDFAGAEREFQKALATSPNYAEAHHWYAIYLANLGRHDEAEQEAKWAVELDPLSLLMNMTPVLNMYLARQYDASKEQLERIIDMEPSFMPARSVLGNVLVQQGRYDEAMIQYQKLLELIKGNTEVEVSVKAIIARTYARWGKQDKARELLEEVTEARTASPYSVAAIHAALGETENAFKCLNLAFERRDPQLVSLKVDPSLDDLRSDARFEELMKRVGIPK